MFDLLHIKIHMNMNFLCSWFSIYLTNTSFQLKESMVRKDYTFSTHESLLHLTFIDLKMLKNSLVRRTIIKKPTSNNAIKKVEQRTLFLHCWWECRLVQPLWGAARKFLKNLKTKLPYIQTKLEFKKMHAPLYLCQHCS